MVETYQPDYLENDTGDNIPTNLQEATEILVLGIKRDGKPNEELAKVLSTPAGEEAIRIFGEARIVSSSKRRNNNPPN